MPSTATCLKHGNKRAAYICEHLFASQAANTSVGLTWFEDDTEDLQAFCDDCWSAGIEEFERRTSAGARTVCIECLDAIAALNDTWLDFGQK